MQTNNSLEGFHNRLNGSLNEMHPTLWKCIDKLKMVDESVYSDVLQWQQGYDPYASKKWAQIEAQKLAVVRSFPNVEIMDYLRAVANRLVD